MNNRQILHVDMNSFFATAEQQANPFLRGKPLGVKGSKAKRTILAATSIEAKRVGIKTGFLAHEAKEVCPEINIVTGEPRKYSYILNQLVNIFEKYSDKVEIFSIDECFIDVTNSANLFADKKTKDKHQVPNNIQTKNSNISELNGATNIANLIKGDIKRDIGEWMTCSIGIAENKFLAKLGSDLEKPDGLVVITPNHKKQITKNKQNHKFQNRHCEKPGDEAIPETAPHPFTMISLPRILTVDEALLNCDLEDFCGIGKRINNRLRKMNIYNVNDLRAASDFSLQKEFGVYGLKIKRWAFGIDNSEITPHQFQKEAKSFSKSRTLNKDTTSKKELKRNLYLLCEVLGANMRSEGYWGNTIGLWLRYSSFSGFGKGSKIKKWTCDGYEIFKYSAAILDEVELKQPVRAIGVWVSGVQPEKNIPRVFFPEDKLNEGIVQTIDTVNDKYGELTLMRASTCAMKLKEVVSGMGRKKI